MEQTIRCVIVDDEPASRELLARYIEKHPYLELMHSFSDGTSAFSYLRQAAPDILFLDISMPGLSGLELIESLHSSGVAFVFVTAYAQYAKEAFDLDAVDYLLKPVPYERFCRSVMKAIRRRGKEQRETLTVNSGKDIFHIPVDQVAWIKAENYYVEIYGDAFPGGKMTVRFPLYKLEQRLDPAVFFKLNRSVIVNVRYVRAVKKQDIVLRNNKVIHVSRMNKDALDKLSKILLDKGAEKA